MLPFTDLNVDAALGLDKAVMATSGAVEGDEIQVAIEVPHGPVVEALIERGFKVHAINPKQMDRFRDRFTLAGAKDDSRNAEVMASALRTDPRCFRLLTVADPVDQTVSRTSWPWGDRRTVRPDPFDCGIDGFKQETRAVLKRRGSSGR